jgi:hypothetical protein
MFTEGARETERVPVVCTSVRYFWSVGLSNRFPFGWQRWFLAPLNSRIIYQRNYRICEPNLLTILYLISTHKKRNLRHTKKLIFRLWWSHKNECEKDLQSCFLTFQTAHRIFRNSGTSEIVASPCNRVICEPIVVLMLIWSFFSSEVSGNSLIMIFFLA